jgi:4-hydroxy-3-methylbut-2-enyl diphosphate reductase
MKITVAKNAGFCFGVKRAMEMAYKCAKGSEGRVYSLNEIIHNPQEVKRLEAAGARHVKKIKDIKEGSTAIVSTHGITPAEEKELKKKCGKVLDTTCPYVKKIHGIVGRLAAEKYGVIIVGDKDHLEVQGILGYAGENGRVVSSIDEVKALKPGPKTGIVAQTTQNAREYQDIICVITEKMFAVRQAEVRAFHTICDATHLRQDETVVLAENSDVMIIIGGRNSANTKRLYELSKKAQKNTHHIEDASELRESWFKGCKKAGISGGASTPESSIREVVEKIGEME